MRRWLQPQATAEGTLNNCPLEAFRFRAVAMAVSAPSAEDEDMHALSQKRKAGAHAFELKGLRLLALFWSHLVSG